jgi:hypothetical protein
MAFFMLGVLVAALVVLLALAVAAATAHLPIMSGRSTPIVDWLGSKHIFLYISLIVTLGGILGFVATR